MWPTIIRVLNIIALLLGILPIWPYGYYTLLRIFTSIVFGILCYVAYQTGKRGLTVAFGVTVFIYNPIFPMHLGREIWTLVNLLTIVLIIISFKLLDSKKNNAD